MTQLTHPKLTDRVIERFIKMYGEDKQEARLWLGETLGVGKTQSYDWAARILTAFPEWHHSDIPERYNGPKLVLSPGPVPISKRPIRRLFWDIETSPNVVFAWRAGYKLNINADSIISERKIICIGYKWEGNPKVTVLRWDENQDDKEMLKEFLKVANQADEMVHQNGDQFDLPWFRTRCLFHGFQCMPDYKTADTLQWARRKFYFNSNKLDYIAKYLGIGQKIKTGFGLWKDIVLNKCPEAMEKMTTYCGHDVVLLEKVWNRLRLYVLPKTHTGVLNGGEKWSCPHCGSENVTKSKKKVTAAGTVQHQMQCQDCGGYYTINDAAFRAYKKAKNKV
jgi:predicted PolB exonuclease-like 3'-5' exonuclease/predicted RNA-binding Zn-ribbon protein involved in translation (DUF1610 family)